MRYQYTGSDPQEDPDGGIAHPGDVRDFAADPDWGAWTLLPGDDAGEPESPAAPPPPPSPAAAPESPAAATADAPGTEG